MSEVCEALHRLAQGLVRHSFPFDRDRIPRDGIYLLFEVGESAHGAERIVRIGSHTGSGQLRSRLEQHFLTEKKDRSIFRKNIGRALLSRANDPFLHAWELDLTTTASRKRHASSIDFAYQEQIEAAVSQFIRANFSFVAFELRDKAERLAWEAKLISTVSVCQHCRPSGQWLGLYSPKEKVRQSGLWLVQHLYKTPASAEEFYVLEKLLEKAAG